ncbi:MAG: hypothetical protein ACM3TR_10480 [Caulobacteraceae bacterium]
MKKRSSRTKHLERAGDDENLVLQSGEWRFGAYLIEEGQGLISRANKGGTAEVDLSSLGVKGWEVFNIFNLLEV